MATRYYRPELDALRCFAFLAVFSGHLSMIQARWYQPIIALGGYGMSIFFMLSAYLIITILLREKETAGTVNLRAFAMRRVLCIWPLYFLVLFAGYFLGRFYHGNATVSGHAVLAFSFLLGNLFIFTMAGSVPSAPSGVCLSKNSFIWPSQPLFVSAAAAASSPSASLPSRSLI
jgi:peptidoglycan/LPS O-acetylase OafA/YrhL